MGRLISEDEFTDLLRGFDRTSLRLEAQPVYAIGEEQPELDRFLAGSPRSPTEIGWWRDWLDEAAAATRLGKHLSRIRVIPSTGPTDYQRWLIWADPWYAQAGVDVRYIRQRQAEQIGLPLGLPLQDDWQLLDGKLLIKMLFTRDGEVGSKMLTTDPVVVAQYQRWWDLAVRNATPASQITAA